MVIGRSALEAARSQDDSPTMYPQSTLENYADQYGKSVSTIRKIIDGTAWVEAFYPDLLMSPPERFPLTQALQLRAIHRLDPHRAKDIADAVFSGKLTRRELTEILGKVKEGRFGPSSEAANRPSKKKVSRTRDLESRVQTLLNPLLKERGCLPTMEVRPGTDIWPLCDFVVSDNETAKIAVEVRSLPPKTSKERLLSLLGALLLWQSKGLSVWLFVPHEASEGISELQAIISESGLDPIEVFVVGQKGVMHQKQSG